MSLGLIQPSTQDDYEFRFNIGPSRTCRPSSSLRALSTSQRTLMRGTAW